MNIRGKIVSAAILFSLLLLGTSTLIPIPARATTDPILGTAGNFQIVSGAAISLGGALTGLDPTKTSTLTSAVNDLGSAIANLSASPATSVPADLGGKTFQPGTYAAAGGAAVAMTGNVILDGNNDCSSKFIFVTPAAMNTTAGISITLINDAKPNNVYFVAGGAITTGASNNLAGNFLSSAAITVGASSAINGRFLGMAAVTVGASVGFQEFPISGCSKLTGSLSISVPENLITRNLDPGETVTIEMGRVVVADTRGISKGAFWTVYAHSSSFSDGDSHTLSAENLGYSIQELTESGGITSNRFTLHSMLEPSSVLGATTGKPINGASWIPIITLAIPENQSSGRYAGVIVHSVA